MENNNTQLTLREVTTGYHPQSIINGKSLTSSGQAKKTFSWLSAMTKEHFVCAHVNTKNKLISYEVVAIGSLNGAIVHPREVYKAAILANAAAIIVLHNHPSGDSSPSPDDIALTKRLAEAGRIIGIELFDHVIIGTDSGSSLKELGYI